MLIHIHGGLYLNSNKIPLLYERIMKCVFSWDTPLVVLSDVEKSGIVDRFNAKIVYVLPNCVDLKDASTYSRQFRKGTLRLGYLGRIEVNKGMNELLEACCRLLHRGVDFELTFAGKEEVEGSIIPEFGSRLGERFKYIGIVSGESKALFMKNIDVFVMPSYFEGLPMSLLECMSYAIVPIVTPVGSIPTVVDDNVNGLFVKKADVDSVVVAISKLAHDKALVERLGSAARNTIFSSFSPGQYIQSLNAIYGSL